jgi:hypothetical protein
VYLFPLSFFFGRYFNEHLCSLQEYDELAEEQQRLDEKLEEIENNPPRYLLHNIYQFIRILIEKKERKKKEKQRKKRILI